MIRVPKNISEYGISSNKYSAKFKCKNIKESHSPNIGTAIQILALKMSRPICCLEKNTTPKMHIIPTKIQE